MMSRTFLFLFALFAVTPQTFALSSEFEIDGHTIPLAFEIPGKWYTPDRPVHNSGDGFVEILLPNTAYDHSLTTDSTRRHFVSIVVRRSKWTPKAGGCTRVWCMECIKFDELESDFAANQMRIESAKNVSIGGRRGVEITGRPRQTCSMDDLESYESSDTVFYFVPNAIFGFDMIISGPVHELTTMRELVLSISFDSSMRIAVDSLLKRKIVEGYPDGSLRLENPINRAEFTKIVVNAARIAKGTGTGGLIGSNCFRDVSDEWFAPFVCTAQMEQLIDGYPDGTFRPASNVNFAEAAKIVVNAFELNVPTRADDTWFTPFVRALSKQNAIPITITTLDQQITRGEMVEMIYRLMENITDQPSNSADMLLR